jgi:hypothetical protein
MRILSLILCAVVLFASGCTGPRVADGLRIQHFTHDGQNMTVTVSDPKGSGVVYQLQETTDLQNPNWVNIGPAVTAESDTAVLKMTTGMDPRKFYRVVIPDK